MKLQRQIVVVLDLLGFRDRMKEIGSNQLKNTELLHEYNRVVGTAFDRLCSEDNAHLLQFKGFTDNVVLCRPLRDSVDEEASFWFINDAVAKFQLSLALEGWFVRGGIAIGDFYMDQRIVFGPALIEAYDLEQKKAVYPRIVMSEECKNFMRSFVEYYADRSSAPQNLDILVDIDKQAFINYLLVDYDYEEWMLGYTDPTLNYLQKHKEQVENQLKLNQQNERVWAKYRWVADYHNFIIRYKFSERPEDLLINKDILGVSPTELYDEELPPDFEVPRY